MDNQFDKPQKDSSGAEAMQALRDNLRLAEQQGNESEVLRLENEIRVIESVQANPEKGIEQTETVSEIKQETVATQEQLPKKEAVAEEIMSNVEELTTTLAEKEPKFYSEKAKMLLGRLGQITAGTVAAGSFVFAGLALHESLQTFIEMDGPVSVATGKAFVGSIEFTRDGEVVAMNYYAAVIALGIALAGVTGVAGIEEKMDKIKSKMQLIKNKFRTA
jgi:hypothetical protein